MKNKPLTKYEADDDIMHVFIGRQSNAFDDEDFPGVYVNRDDDTGEIVGFTILDYERKNKSVVQKHFPEYFN